MKQITYPLKLGARGAEVTDLHEALDKIGARIPTIESEANFFSSVTQVEIKRLQTRFGLEPSGEIDQRTADRFNSVLGLGVPKVTHSVQGSVTDSTGKPLPNHQVRVYDREIGAEESLLGSEITDSKGEYRFEYLPERLPGKKQVADILVRVFPNSQSRKPLVSSQVIFSAASAIVVNLSVGEAVKDASEFSRVELILDPLLKGLVLEKLNQDDIDQLAHKTNLKPIIVSYYVKAFIDSQGDVKKAELLYGLYRMNANTSLVTGMQADTQFIRDKVKEADTARIIDASNSDASISRTVNEIKDTVSKSGAEGQLGFDTISRLMTFALLTQADKQTFLAHYFRHADDLTGFWQKLKADTTLSQTKINALQVRVEVNTLLSNHVDLTEHLVMREGVSKRSDLASLSAHDIEGVMRTHGIKAPDEFEGENESDKRSKYSKFVAMNIEYAMPTSVLANRWKSDRQTSTESDIVRFFDNNAEFEFDQTNVNEHLLKNPRALTGVRDKSLATRKLRQVQNLFRFTPDFNRFAAVKALWKADVRSAHRAKLMGEKAFVDSFETDFGSRVEAERAYARASKLASLTILSLLRNFHDTNDIAPAVFKKTSLNLEENPELLQELEQFQGAGTANNLKTLFGGLDYCDCQHCESVLSPAAYLVDLLVYLDSTKVGDASNGITGLDALLERRSDIQHIELNCENTNTPLPYIDLVNEILEADVAAESATHQTNQTSPEVLQANPEHLSVAAYNKLADSIFPWQLPFNLWLVETRAYLGQLAVDRADLMQVFTKKDDLSWLGSKIDNAPVSDRDIEIASEALAIAGSKARELIITHPSNNPDRRERWGIESGNAVDVIKAEKIRPFLERVQLTYEDLSQLLQCEYINPKNEPALIDKFSKTDGKQCSLDEAEFDELTSDNLDRLYRFIRLKKTFDVEFYELDKAFRAFPISDMKEFLVYYHIAKHVQSSLNVEFNQLVLWWSNTLDSREYNKTGRHELVQSVYAQVFLNPAVFAGGDTISELRDDFQLNAEGTELASASAVNPIKLDSEPHRSAILAACRVNDDELQLIIENDLSNSPELNLINLSHIYRIASFARALDLSISEYYLMVKLFGTDPVATPEVITNPAMAINIVNGKRFIELVDLINRSPFDVADLGYLLLNDEDSIKRLDKGEDRIKKDLDSLRSELLTIEDTPIDPDNNNEDQILNSLEAYLAEQMSLSLVATQKLIDGIKIAGESCRDVFFSAEFLREQNSNYSNRVIDSYNKLAKAAYILNKFELDEGDQLLIAAEGAIRKDAADNAANVYGLPDFNLVPTAADRGNLQENLSALILFIKSAEINEQFFTLGTSFYTYLESIRGENEQNTYLYLKSATNWLKEDIEKLKLKFGFSLSGNKKLHAEWVVILGKAFSLLQRLGVSAAQAWEWGDENITYNHAQANRLAVKAKYDPDEWLRLAPALRDPIRELQRDALLAYVGHKRKMTNSQIYSHFLVDAETNSLMDTSRIKLAISSVQLFVQRALLNIQDPDEPDIHFPDEDAKEWQWRKNYRVWEANRHVFMYPENWIYPELRDDKTPLFLEMESALAQSDITNESAEQAYLDYLESLRQIANLEIVGLYDEQEEDSSKQTLHVIGRTRSKPAQYYYRRWEQQRTWTAWEPIDAGIDAEHVIPVVHNRRLFLFWPQYTEVAEKITAQELKATSGQTHTPSLPKKHSEIRIAWSHNKSGQWSETRVSDDFIKSPPSEHSLDKSELYVYGKHRGSDLYLYVLNFSRYSIGENIQMPIDHGIFKYNDATDDVEVVQKNESGSSNHLGENFGNSASNRVSMSISSDFGITNEPSALQVQAFPGSNHYYNQFKDTIPNDGLRMWSSVTQLSLVDVIHGGAESHVLKKDTKNNRITIPHQYNFFASQAPFFYADPNRTFFVTSNKFSFYKPTITFPENIHEFHIAAHKERGPTQASGSNPLPGEITDINAIANVVFDTRFRNIQGHWSLVETAANSIQIESNTDRNSIIGSGFVRNTNSYVVVTKANYRFHAFYHPYVSVMFEQVNRFGVEGLLAPSRKQSSNYQMLSRQLGQEEYFEGSYLPTSAVLKPYPVEEMDFSERGTYSQYNWELFFHAPLFIADNLRKNQKFEEAQKWFHYIFDPTLPIEEELSDEKQKMRFWKIKPFFNYDDDYSLEALLATTNITDLELEMQIEAWEQNPFNPHLVARMRIVAYMKAVVMKYIDNLIEWGDMLFRRDSIESINEATQLYVLAMQLLGPAPVRTSGNQQDNSPTFSSLDITSIDEALEGQESLVPNQSDNAPTSTGNGSSVTNTFMYFCLTPNEKLMTYWDTVADRLFKIRNGMNIEGVRRAIRLFEPRLDPGMLVRATAAGVDIASMINNAMAELPHYRFTYMLQVAKDFCADVRSLGSSLLQALEKKDSEGMQLLTSRHQVDLLKQIRDIKLNSINEAEAQLSSLEERKGQLENNIRYYTELIETRSTAASVQLPGISISSLSLSDAEISSLTSSLRAQELQNSAFIASDLSSTISTIPDAIIGASGPGGTAHATTIVGGQMLAKQAERLASAFRHTAGAMNTKSSMSATVAGYERRQQEWVLQKETNEMELAGLEQSIIAADLRLQMAKQELRNHDLQTKHAETELEFLESKFTNQELYNWMSGRLSALYFQTYRMAYDLAKQAEKCYEEELVLDPGNIIEFGHWDNLKKGLLAGESLQKDLRRLEYKYIENNSRDFEITKHFSLLNFAPIELNELKTNGECVFSLSEALFDLDYPGHFARRIKSVNLTMPCVTGPYTTVCAQLTLVGDRIRRKQGTDDSELKESSVKKHQSVVTSSAQNDAGLFDFNFRDERYLPFENAGAVSVWHLKLTNPEEMPAFDYQTISDVVLSINYYAKKGDQSFQDQVNDELTNKKIDKAVELLAKEGNYPLTRLMSIATTNPDEWHQFMNPEDDKPMEISIMLGRKDFPSFLRRQNLKELSVKPIFAVSDSNLYDDANKLLEDVESKLDKDILNLKNDEEIKITMTITREDGDIINSNRNSIRKFTIGSKPNRKLNPVLIRDLIFQIDYKFK